MQMITRSSFNRWKVDQPRGGCAKLACLDEHADVATWPFMTLTLKVTLPAPFLDEFGENMATNRFFISGIALWV